MATFANLSAEERVGLGVAVVLHGALAGLLIVRSTEVPDYTPPERIDVSLATDISLESTAPDPSAQPAAAIAPVVEEVPQPEVIEQPQPREPVTEPVRQPVVEPPRPAPTRPRATATPAPRPTATPTPRPTPTPTPTPTPAATRTQAASGSRLGADFLEGSSDAQGTTGTAAAVVGPAQQASIAQAIIRQLRPHWTPPSGVDVDKLETVVRFRLNRDGSLAATPEVLRTNGQNDSNRNQVTRHQEQAIRAVRLAAPFNLPEQYYSGWRVVTSNFDNRLAQ